MTAGARTLWKRTSEISQAISAIALVVIGYATYQVTQQSVDVSRSDVAQKQQLAIEIESLAIQRRQLLRSVDALNEQQTRLQNDVATAEKDLRSLNSENGDLRGEIDTREKNIGTLKIAIQEFEKEKTHRLESETRQTFLTHLNSTLTAQFLSGSRMDAMNLASVFGQPMDNPKPIEFYYPRPTAEQWSFISTSMRTWPQSLPSERRNYASKLVAEFVSNCRPVGAPPSFDFEESYPTLQKFESSVSLWQNLPSQMSIADYEAFKRKSDAAYERERLVKANLDAFENRFNKAKGTYMALVVEAIVACDAIPADASWKSETIKLARANQGAWTDLYERMNDDDMKRFIAKD